ncbi:hypothetical protein NGM10_03890 [Halorussus salilacus]|uniref:hypothetical protein n=1 Tax=Halorussus salilacus TaxID=2953750 RepID=UPI00209FCEB7|nr:hypothetical protein [Halorussus salilacus]USZ68882.1 hypothetical protein NGM10_03890 [Halorussus salilacus]
MSRAATRIGCPNCDDPTVEVARVVGERDPEFHDAGRLKGTSVDCSNCGDEFEVYFY